MSTIDFLIDLYEAGVSILEVNDKISRLRHFLEEINQNLPACVYIPFNKGKT